MNLDKACRNLSHEISVMEEEICTIRSKWFDLKVQSFMSKNVIDMYEVLDPIYNMVCDFFEVSYPKNQTVYVDFLLNRIAHTMMCDIIYYKDKLDTIEKKVYIKLRIPFEDTPFFGMLLCDETYDITDCWTSVCQLKQSRHAIDMETFSLDELVNFFTKYTKILNKSSKLEKQCWTIYNNGTILFVRIIPSENQPSTLNNVNYNSTLIFVTIDDIDNELNHLIKPYQKDMFVYVATSDMVDNLDVSEYMDWYIRDDLSLFNRERPLSL